MFLVKCLNCNQQKIMDITENLIDEICPICSHPGDRLEIVASVEELMPDPDLIASSMASI